jgi:hypothetical protein
MTVQIGSTSYDTYSTVAEADAYLAGYFSASAWRAADATDKARAVITAARMLDRMGWLGSKAESDQPNAWPRTGTGIATVLDDEVPVEIVNASIELANAILTGTDVLGADTEQTVKRQAAGSVSIEYFRSFEDAGRLPLGIMELLAQFLQGATPAAGVRVSGVDRCSDFEHSFRPGASF